MSHTIDGFLFEDTIDRNQIIALAQLHRQKLEEAIYQREIHLGDFCLAQRKRVYDYTRQLSPEDKAKFYQIYDGELRRIADDDQLHPADAEAGVSVFAIFLVLALIAFILYFAFVRSLI